MKKTKITAILDAMQELFGDYPTTELNYETPFQCLVAVMLSAQTTDKQVNKVTATLFEQVQAPQDVIDMWLEKFSEAIRSIGLWKGKAKNIVRTSEMLLTLSEQLLLSWDCHVVSLHSTPRNDDSLSWDTLVYHNSLEVYKNCGYVIPDTIEEMIKLPGVGIKTAKVVLYVLYRQHWVAVDTHVHRVMNRLGVVTTKTPEQTSKQLETIIPDNYKDIAHHTIIYFGRYLCTARKPKCKQCPLIDICVWYSQHKWV